VAEPPIVMPFFTGVPRCIPGQSIDTAPKDGTRLLLMRVKNPLLTPHVSDQRGG
jgi:hypothetical protein